MATLTTVDTRKIGATSFSLLTLTASDILPYDPTKKQILLLINNTGGSLTATIDGADGTTVLKDGVGSVAVSAGLAVVVPAAGQFFITLSSIRDYLQGIVTVSGGTGLRAVILDI